MTPGVLVPSLSLDLGSGGTRIVLRTRPGLEGELRDLALRFRSSSQVASTIFHLGLDDLLTNLRLLTTWKHADVEWSPRLAALVADSVTDAKAVADRLLEQQPFPNAVITDDVMTAWLGDDWKADLTQFQRRDVAKLLSLRHGANFSVPGAGKTRVGLALFQALRKAEGLERLLVVGPKSSFDAWTTENSICFQAPLEMNLIERYPVPAADALVINYERLPGAVGPLSKWLDERPSMIILDEAHRMKLGVDGSYGSACLSLGPHARLRLILTGTPAPNGVKDLENLFSFVWPGTGRQKVLRAIAGGDLAQASRSLQPLFTRTTKGELGLPKVTTRVRRLRLPPLHREVYDALLGRFASQVGQTDDLEALGKVMVYTLMAAISPALLAVGTTKYEPLAYRVPPMAVPPGTPLYQLMQDLPSYELSPKYLEVLKIVKENAEQERKTLVWSTFIRSLNTLQSLLGAFSPALVHGGTEDRDGQIQRFRDDPNCWVLLSNPATLGEGISLHHECHDSVYVDRDFAAGRYLQSLDRIHRLGLDKDTETRVTVLVSEATIDEIVDQRLAVKLDFMGRILDDPAVRELADLDEEPAVGGGLDSADLIALIGHLRGYPG